MFAEPAGFLFRLTTEQQDVSCSLVCQPALEEKPCLSSTVTDRQLHFADREAEARSFVIFMREGDLSVPHGPQTQHEVTVLQQHRVWKLTASIKFSLKLNSVY